VDYFSINQKKWKENGYAVEYLYVIDLVVYMEKCRFGCEESILLQIV
jgi:hypothetical protein